MKKTTNLTLVVLAVGLGFAGWIWQQKVADTKDLWPLNIVSAHAQHQFSVELADTPEKRQSGLMFRKELTEDMGMLFVYEQPSVRTMWMKNTPLSLDMLFIDKEGTILKIVPHTVPYSETFIVGAPRTQYVLELRAGTTQRAGIRVGDQVKDLPPFD